MKANDDLAHPINQTLAAPNIINCKHWYVTIDDTLDVYLRNY